MARVIVIILAGFISESKLTAQYFPPAFESGSRKSMSSAQPQNMVGKYYIQVTDDHQQWKRAANLH